MKLVVFWYYVAAVAAGNSRSFLFPTKQYTTKRRGEKREREKEKKEETLSSENVDFWLEDSERLCTG